MKKLFWPLIIFLFILSVFVNLKNVFVAKLLKNELEKRFGVTVQIANLDVSFLGGRIKIEGLTIGNPPGFEKREFVYAPQVFIICNVFDFLVRKDLNIYYLDLNIERFNIIKNHQGEINFKKIHILNAPEIKGQFKCTTEVFKFSLSDVYFIDYTADANQAQLTRYPVDIKDAVFGKLDSFEDIVHLVTTKIMANNQINKVLGVTVTPIAEGLTNVVIVSGDTVKKVAKGIFGLPLSFFKSKN